MKVLIVGGSGFIGSALSERLIKEGHSVLVADLREPSVKQVEFQKANLLSEEIDPKLIEGLDAVINLAGVSISEKWTESYHNLIYQSRVQTTRNLISSISKAKLKPAVFISASATGYYGDRGEEVLTESLPQGVGFLANVCADWEKEASAAKTLGLRVVYMRTAPVLGRGGLLEKILPVFKLGLGGAQGSGRQWYPWIHINDLIEAYVFALNNNALHGPVNVAAPEEVTNKDFAKTLGRVLGKPALLHVPGWLLKLVLGEMSSVLLSGARVRPKALIDAGMGFSFPTLEKALEDVLKNSK